MSNSNWRDNMAEGCSENDAAEYVTSGHLALGISVSVSVKDPDKHLSKDITYTGYGQPNGPSKYELRERVDTIPESIGIYNDKGWHTEFEFEGSQLNAVLEHLYEGHSDVIALRSDELRDYPKEEKLVLTGYWD